MTNFAAINLEPDESIHNEIDPTRQIQIDEAFKKFQNALKLHAQGPHSYDKAEDAYRALFLSEIFKSPEAATDFERSCGSSLEVDSQEYDSNLSQILYLAFKNRGQFLLDQIQIQRKATVDSTLGSLKFGSHAYQALDDFSSALDRDPSDAELWHKAARVASFLNSGRISRYCLEASIELDDDPSVDEIEPPSIAEALAGERLRSHLLDLADQVTLSHPALRPWLTKELPSLLREQIDPVPFLSKTEATNSSFDSHPISSEATTIFVSSPTWASIGAALVQYISLHGELGTRVSIEVTGEHNTNLENDSHFKIKTSIQSDNTVVKQKHDAQHTAQVPDFDPEQERVQDHQLRKRSQSIAGFPDDDIEHKRSKRIRRRETIEGIKDPSVAIAAQMAPCQGADQNLFKMTKDLLENIGASTESIAYRIVEILDSCATEDRTKTSYPPAEFLRDAITSFSEEKAKILLNKRSISFNIASILETPKTNESPHVPLLGTKNMRNWISIVNSGWFTIQQVAALWVSQIFPTYITHKWPEDLKAKVIEVLWCFDEEVWQAVKSKPDVIQTALEIHIDHYDQLMGDNSVAKNHILHARQHLDQWLYRAAVAQIPTTRFLWSAVCVVQLQNEASRDHLIHAWSSVQKYIADNVVWLPNNGFMPEISTTAAEREISKLTTMDFFASLRGNMGPVAIIDSLEPVLNPKSCQLGNTPIREIASSGLRNLWKVITCGSVELRLFLWDRLGNAYAEVKYTTKQFSCRLRAIEMLVADLEASDRSLKLLRYLDELLVAALSAALNDVTAFDILDAKHLQSSARALVKLACILHMAALVDDEQRFGISPLPGGKMLEAFMTKLRELQVRTWSLLYRIFRMGTDMDSAQYMSAIHQVLGLRRACKCSNKVFLKMMRNDLLRHTNVENWKDHMGQVLYDLYGIKLGVGLWDVQDHGCPREKLERRIAVLLAERVIAIANEMQMKDLVKSDLKNTIEHMQTAIGQTKSNSQMIINIRKFNDTLKRPIHPLRLYQALSGSVAVDAVTIHNAESSLARHGWFFLLGMVALSRFKAIDLNKRQTPGATDDLRMATTFLRQQLQFTPEKWEAWYRLGECFDYELDEMVLWSAEKLNKERDDLVRLQRSTIHCYTLAVSCVVNDPNPACYAEPSLSDYDPNTFRSGNKNISHIDINGNDGDEENDNHVLYELYLRFAMRLYASSREPFAMEAFKHSDQERYFIGGNAGSFKRIVHSEMTPHQVWRYAAALFRRAMWTRPKEWLPPYMISKCLWKMGDTKKAVSVLERAIKAARSVKRPRGGDPILEPAYKLVSIVHKLVVRGCLSPESGVRTLFRQWFARDIVIREQCKPMQMEEWQRMVISVLRILQDMDKANWQHRIIARHARIIFDYKLNNAETVSETSKLVQAKAAFSILRESMFTKTMVMNVWKCDAERPGRHFVYMEQYVRLVVSILRVLGDRNRLVALLRRLRKRGADYYHFGELWHNCCYEYLSMIRTAFHVPVIEDDRFRATNLEEFDTKAEKLVVWAEIGSQHRLLEGMKEAFELKKLNGNLMKAQAIDDIISDCFTVLWQEVQDVLPEPVSLAVMEKCQKIAKLKDHAHADTPIGPLNQGQVSFVPSEQPSLDGAGQTLRVRRSTVRRQDILRAAERTILRSAEFKFQKGISSAGRSHSTSKSKCETPVVSDLDIKEASGVEDVTPLKGTDSEQKHERHTQEDGEGDRVIEREERNRADELDKILIDAENGDSAARYDREKSISNNGVITRSDINMGEDEGQNFNQSIYDDQGHSLYRNNRSITYHSRSRHYHDPYYHSGDDSSDLTDIEELEREAPEVLFPHLRYTSSALRSSDLQELAINFSNPEGEDGDDEATDYGGDEVRVIDDGDDKDIKQEATA